MSLRARQAAPARRITLVPMTAVQRKDHLDTFAITLLVACCAFWGFQQILIKFTGQL